MDSCLVKSVSWFEIPGGKEAQATLLLPYLYHYSGFGKDEQGTEEKYGRLNPDREEPAVTGTQDTTR